MTTPTPHLEALLQHDIDLIRAKLLEMAALAGRALSRAFEAFLKRDRQLAYSVILRDQDVDALDTELDRLCLEFIIRHQPAAGHLRFVYSASKIVTGLERVGDYAESMARQVLLVTPIPFDVPTGKFSEIAALAIPMLHDAVLAFVGKDADLARATMATEPRVNQIRDTLTADLIEWRREGRLPLEALAPLLTFTRRFERVSDQATNICEEALYFATGEYLRHLPRAGFRVLFVDETNGCLSQMAEAIGNALNSRRFSFASAGITAGAVDPETIRFLAGKGLDISQHRTRSVAEIPDFDQLQVVVSLGVPAQRGWPQKPAKRTVGLDWFIEDPSKARGTPGEAQAAYEQAFESLGTHVRDLVDAILGDDQQHQQDGTHAAP